MDGALLSSVKQDWETPDELLDLVRAVDAIALDPCTTPDNPCNARHFFTPTEDGLSRSWRSPYPGARRRGGMSVTETGRLVFVNPPYGRELPHWADKCIAESVVTYGVSDPVPIVLLVPARTDTKWFNRACDSAQALCLLRGRLTFRGAPHPAPFPSAIFYWGRSSELFANVFTGRGRVFLLPSGGD